MADPCLICGEPASDQTPLICGSCRAAPTAQLLENGFTMDVATHTGNRGGSTHSVTAPEHITSGLAVTLARENVGHKLKKLFTKSAELQVGEAGFDDRVYIEYGEEADAEAFRDPTVQELILRLISAGKITVTENSAALRIAVPTTSLTSDDVDLGLALLVCVLDRIRRRQFE